MQKFKFLGNKKRREDTYMLPIIHDKSSKFLTNRGVMNHLRGIPPAPNWSNKYSSLLLGDNLLFISNLYIVNIDLNRREFSQLVYSTKIESKEKHNVICEINEDIFITVTNEGNFIIFRKYFNTNLEDKRAYFKETGQSFKFMEISNLKESQIKTIIFSKLKNVLICGDNKGNIHIIKIQNLSVTQEEKLIDMKYLYSVNVCKENNLITDISLIQDKSTSTEFLIISDSSGALYLFSFINNENLFVKINQIGIKNEIVMKYIFSIDILYLENIGIYVLSVLDKNGSISIYSIKIEKELTNFVSKWNLILFDKNRFNDKFYEEKYLYFTTRIIYNPDLNNLIRILITSNKGKIFYFDISESDLTEEQKAEIEVDHIRNPNMYKEITENPHTMAIFSSGVYLDKIFFISADRLITFFKLPDFIFEYDIKTLGSKANYLLKQMNEFRNLYVLNQDNFLYQYNYSKNINGLAITSRRDIKFDKKNYKSQKNVSLLAQSKFNEYIFAFVQEEIESSVKTQNKKKKISIIVYNFLSDEKLGKIYVDNKISKMIFSNWRKFKIEDYKKKDIPFGNKSIKSNEKDFKLTKKQEKIASAVEQLFSNCEKYNLLYILDTSGIVTVWDYINNKINRFKLIKFNENIFIDSLIVPIDNTNSEYMIALGLNQKSEINFYLFNQMVSLDIASYKLTIDQNKIQISGKNNNLHSEDMNSKIIDAEYDSFKDNKEKILVCDYYSNKNSLQLLLADNCRDIKLLYFNKYFFDFISSDICSSYTQYSNTIKKYEEFFSENETIKEKNKLEDKNIDVSLFSESDLKKKNIFFNVIEFKKITQGKIKIIRVNKNYSTSDPSINDKHVINFAICQSDGVIKIFDINVEVVHPSISSPIKTPFCNLIFTLFLKYSIKSHFSSILDICWLDDDRLASSSVDNSVKIWNIKMCKLIDLKLGEQVVNIEETYLNSFNSKVKDNNTTAIHLKLMNNFNKVNSACFYQQSSKISNEFVDYFSEYYKNKFANKSSEEDGTYDTNKINSGYAQDFLLFYHSNDSQVNFRTAENLIRIELTSCLDVGNISKFLKNIINLMLYSKYFNLYSNFQDVMEVLKQKFSNIKSLSIIDEINQPILISFEQISEILENYRNFEFLNMYSNFLPTEYFKRIEEINFSFDDLSKIDLKKKEILFLIKQLTTNNLYVEAIVIYKLFKLTDIELFLSIIDKLSCSIYQKQTFQSVKCKRVIEILRNYNNLKNIN